MARAPAYFNRLTFQPVFFFVVRGHEVEHGGAGRRLLNLDASRLMRVPPRIPFVPYSTVEQLGEPLRIEVEAFPKRASREIVVP